MDRYLTEKDRRQYRYALFSCITCILGPVASFYPKLDGNSRQHTMRLGLFFFSKKNENAQPYNTIEIPKPKFCH